MIALLASGLALAFGSAAADQEAGKPAFLVFSKTQTFRHDSIPAGVTMLRELAAQHNYAFDHTEDSSRFTDDELAAYGAVVFLSTTGDLLNDAEQRAFERFVENGGGFVGIHAAADAEYDWAWYRELVGALFRDHPPIQTAVVDVADPEHPSTQMLPDRWERSDEWYNYRRNPRGEVRVLLTLDETSYSGGAHDGDHPIAWCRHIEAGRSWYTGLGHTVESYRDPLFREHVLGGLRWALGLEESACEPAE